MSGLYSCMLTVSHAFLVGAASKAVDAVDPRYLVSSLFYVHRDTLLFVPVTVHQYLCILTFHPRWMNCLGKGS